MRATEKPKTGSLLASEPFLTDSNFDRSIILLTEHSEDEGSVGFIVNKPLDLQLDEIAVGFPSLKSMVYHGGPVQEDNLFFIHKKGDLLPGSQHICEDLYWGGEYDPLKELIKCKLITANDIRFFLGYSGWGNGQLQSEIDEKSWVVMNDTQLDIFDKNPDDMWKKVLLELGGTYSLWANSPSDPALN